MINQLLAAYKKTPEITYIFCDFYDTIVHRKAHPMQPFKIWAKILIRELNIKASITELYNVRRECMKYLSSKSNLKESELDYQLVMTEVYHRLVNTDKISSKKGFDDFYRCAFKADFKSEACLQYLNESLVETLTLLKKKGVKIYCVSDFHLPEALIRKLINFHDLEHLYDEVYVSASENASKENKGLLFSHILEKEHINSNQVLMIGDNPVSDIANAELHQIKTYFLKHYKHKLRQKYFLLGSDEKDYNRVLRKFEKDLKSNSYPYAEYLIIFHVFIERLYKQAKINKVNDLFFLAREGLFLKRLFDKYQEQIGLQGSEKIKTHYLKISRQGAMQISYKPLEKEGFEHLKSKYDSFSLRQFLKSFLLSESIVLELSRLVKIEPDTQINNFFDSDIYSSLLQQDLFKEVYEENRVAQKSYFNTYLDSFGVNLTKAIHIVDIGWGGTMQECLYRYLGETIPVYGYYLGLQEIYTILERTKRYGLIFSVYPSKSSFDHILMANRQLYEQLLAAPHGSTLGYTSAPDFTVEFHKKEELQVYTNHIAPIQEYMYGKYEELLVALTPLSYNEEIVSKHLLNLKMRLDIIANGTKIKFINDLSKGFYQNIGNNNVGLSYDASALGKSKVAIAKKFLWAPDVMFRYLVKVKPILFSKGLSLLSYPINSIKPYIKFNRYLKGKFFKRGFTE